MRRILSPLVSVLALIVALFAIVRCGESNTTITGSDDPTFSRVEEESFTVGASPTLTVENFVGEVTVNTGESGTIHITATRRSARESDIDRITVEMTQDNDDVRVTVANPEGLKSVPADLAITAPAPLQMDIALGVGNIRCNTRPRGDCLFDVGVGNVELLFPADVEITVDLSTGVGSLSVDYAVAGQSSSRGVGGTVGGAIGTGEEAAVQARVGVGNIELSPQ